MEGAGNDDRKSCTIIWIIENFRYCSQEFDGFMDSPIFDFESLENIKWHLRLLPRGSEAENYIDLCLRRDEEGPELITLDCELVISSMNGSGYRKKYLISKDFEKHHINRYTIIKRSKVLDSNKNRFLQKDSLLVQFRMWRTDGKELKEFWLWQLKKSAIFKLPYTHKKLIEERDKYLPKDVLSLRCGIVISTGDTTDRIESYITGIDDNICDQNFEKYESGISPDLKGDLKSMHREGTLSDTKIRTSTETFPAHTQILGARSPVFRTMFSTDMKERTKECVDITDFDGETVHRLLLYMYTDALEVDLQCQSACQLYAAADKYAVLSLKNKCSSFLERIFSVSSACDILSLADLHQDEELKSSVQEYILLNPEDIFSSEEWQLLKKSNPRLALETMYLGYKGYYEE
ncbi:hypothetical protein CEXT_639851 [Caerostris extrusa]|uniref:Uncharacterized protein n=1 Tax=Caerostris extrusa TaxID=172846 RepID=A0AAV4Y3M7_CAEEX|nr:hypothetical protein CEXT_639851 [Caerostris extrusa]